MHTTNTDQNIVWANIIKNTATIHTITHMHTTEMIKIIQTTPVFNTFAPMIDDTRWCSARVSEWVSTEKEREREKESENLNLECMQMKTLDETSGYSCEWRVERIYFSTFYTDGCDTLHRQANKRPADALVSMMLDGARWCSMMRESNKNCSSSCCHPGTIIS